MRVRTCVRDVNRYCYNIIIIILSVAERGEMVIVVCVK